MTSGPICWRFDRAIFVIFRKRICIRTSSKLIGIITRIQMRKTQAWTFPSPEILRGWCRAISMMTTTAIPAVLASQVRRRRRRKAKTCLLWSLPNVVFVATNNSNPLRIANSFRNVIQPVLIMAFSTNRSHSSLSHFIVARSTRSSSSSSPSSESCL